MLVVSCALHICKRGQRLQMWQAYTDNMRAVPVSTSAESNHACTPPLPTSHVYTWAGYTTSRYDIMRAIPVSTSAESNRACTPPLPTSQHLTCTSTYMGVTHRRIQDHMRVMPVSTSAEQTSRLYPLTTHASGIHLGTPHMHQACIMHQTWHHASNVAL